MAQSCFISPIKNNLMKRFNLLLCACLSTAMMACAQKTSTPKQPTGWTGTWATAVEKPGQGDMPQSSLSNRSLRQVVHVSIGGETMRLRLSNVQSTTPVDIKSVYIADATYTHHINAATATYLTFNGSRSLTLEGGEEMVSDVVTYRLRPQQRLAITINYGARTPDEASCHRGSRTTSYIITGESTPTSDFSKGEEAVHWYNIASIEVERRNNTAVAILGNSITDGRGSTTDAQDRWTDFFAEAMSKNVSTSHIGVLNLGIGGNCVVRGGLSEPGKVRFDRDVLGQTGIGNIIIFEGTNDIGSFGENNPNIADQLIAAYQEFIRKGHERGLKVYGATITPVKGSFYYSEKREAIRQRVNEWIRTTAATATDGQLHFDGCIDFDAAVRDPQDPAALRADLQDDWLHLNPAGYKLMGEVAAEFFKQICRISQLQPISSNF